MQKKKFKQQEESRDFFCVEDLLSLEKQFERVRKKADRDNPDAGADEESGAIPTAQS